MDTKTIIVNLFSSAINTLYCINIIIIIQGCPDDTFRICFLGPDFFNTFCIRLFLAPIYFGSFDKLTPLLYYFIYCTAIFPNDLIVINRFFTFES